MGVIDKKTYTLKCDKCGKIESARILDKGSGWSGSFWGDSAKFSDFATEWSGGGKIEPSLESAKCIHCGSKPTVKSVYSELSPKNAIRYGFVENGKTKAMNAISGRP